MYNAEYNKNYRKSHPWLTHWDHARTRCLPNSKYGKYYPRVTFSLTVSDVKELWLRDKAWLLKKPTIDRINNGNYTKDECRFIELVENSKAGAIIGNQIRWGEK